ncbi:MAG: diguanylate cyclase [Rhodospirillum sp.]|nr:diguanylate cyclase [Rhodospirillum sp.]MCF8490100.1 diguanylate cyclase [Rhodospirillum sp.]
MSTPSPSPLPGANLLGGRLGNIVQSFHANALLQGDEIDALETRLSADGWREAEDLARLDHLAHKLAGSAGSLGFTTMGRDASALEMIVRLIVRRRGDGETGLGAAERTAQAALLARVLVDRIRSSRPEDSTLDLERLESPGSDGPRIDPKVVVTLGLEPGLLADLSLLDIILVEVETLVDWAGRVPLPPVVAVIDMNFANREPTLIQFLRDLPRETTILAVGGSDTFLWRVRAARLGARTYLPHYDAKDLLDHISRIVGESRMGPARVLILEDDEILATLYTAILTEAGMEAEFLTDPTPILDHLSTFEPDVLISDLHMPGYSGTEVAAAIRHGGQWATLPIVFLSREQDLKLQIAALASGADFFLPKPILPEFLVSVALDRADRSRALRNMTLRDPLTHLYNHTASLDFLDREVTRARRGRTPLSAALIDLDHFKKVNDTQGHHTGDHVIQTLARLMRSRLRMADILGRCGGEEFLIILPNTPMDRAVEVIDDLRRAFHALPIETPNGPLTLSFSAGVTGLPGGVATDEASSLDARSLFKLADAGLYDAKRGGRNRVAAKSF